MGLLLNSVKFLEKKKTDSQSISEHVFTYVENIPKVHGPIIESIINSEFWYVNSQKNQLRRSE